MHQVLLRGLFKTLVVGLLVGSFQQMLHERGMTVTEFVDLMPDLRDRDRDNAEKRIHNALLPEGTLRDDGPRSRRFTNRQAIE